MGYHCTWREQIRQDNIGERTADNFYLGPAGNRKLELKVIEYMLSLKSENILKVMAREGWDAEKMGSFMAKKLVEWDAGKLNNQQGIRVLELLKRIMDQSEGQKLEINTEDMSDEELENSIQEFGGIKGNGYSKSYTEVGEKAGQIRSSGGFIEE